MPESQDPFLGQVEQLLSEFDLAIRYDRPAILFGVCPSEFVRVTTEAFLEMRLKEFGQSVVRIRISSEAESNVPIRLVAHSTQGAAIFFVSGLSNDGQHGKLTMRALNARREDFVDFRLRVLIWLTEAEAMTLPCYAPDFWRFRYRVVDFVESAPTETEMEAAEVTDISAETVQSLAKLKEQIVKEMEQRQQVLSLQAEEWYLNAMYVFAKGDYHLALSAARRADQLAQGIANRRPMAARLWIGLSQLYQTLGRMSEATEARLRAVEAYPELATLAANIRQPRPRLRSTKQPTVSGITSPSSAFHYGLIVVGVSLILTVAMASVYFVTPTGFISIITSAIIIQLIVFVALLALVGTLKGEEVSSIFQKLLDRIRLPVFL